MEIIPSTSAAGSPRTATARSRVTSLRVRDLGGRRPTALLLSETELASPGHPSLYFGLANEERARLLAAGAKKVFYRGSSLFRQGAPHEGIFVIETGRIRVFYTSPSGREITLAYWGPGHFVGGPDIFGGGTHQWSGVAAANSSAVFLGSRWLRRLLGEIPGLAVGLIEGLSFKGRCYSAMAQMLGTRSATERLNHLLFHLAGSFGYELDDGVVIPDGFTHAELAYMVGATRQWVTTSLTKLQQQGVLEYSKAAIVVRRPDLLASFCD